MRGEKPAVQLVNLLLTFHLIILISSITVLSIYAVFSSRSRQDRNNRKNSKPIERRKNTSCSFPVTCSDGTMVYFDRRLQRDQRYA